MSDLGFLILAMVLLSLLGGGMGILAVFCIRSVLGRTINPELGAAQVLAQHIEARNKRGDVSMPEAIVVRTILMGRTFTGLGVLLMMIAFAYLGHSLVVHSTGVVVP